MPQTKKQLKNRKNKSKKGVGGKFNVEIFFKIK